MTAREAAHSYSVNGKRAAVGFLPPCYTAAGTGPFLPEAG
jgi:hypothetical protein